MPKSRSRQPTVALVVSTRRPQSKSMSPYRRLRLSGVESTRNCQRILANCALVPRAPRFKRSRRYHSRREDSSVICLGGGTIGAMISYEIVQLKSCSIFPSCSYETKGLRGSRSLFGRKNGNREFRNCRLDPRIKRKINRFITHQDRRPTGYSTRGPSCYQTGLGALLIAKLSTGHISL